MFAFKGRHIVPLYFYTINMLSHLLMNWSQTIWEPPHYSVVDVLLLPQWLEGFKMLEMDFYFPLSAAFYVTAQ